MLLQSGCCGYQQKLQSEGKKGKQVWGSVYLLELLRQRQEDHLKCEASLGHKVSSCLKQVEDEIKWGGRGGKEKACKADPGD